MCIMALRAQKLLVAVHTQDNNSNNTKVAYTGQYV